MPSDQPAPTFEGRFSDGKTASSLRARLTLGTVGIGIRRGDDDPNPLLWPYVELSTGEPLTNHAVDVLLHEPGRTGATLFVAEGSFARRLAERAPHLTARAERWRFARPWVLGAAVLAAIYGAILALNLNPAHAIATLLPDQTRVALGRQVMKSMTEGRRECDEAPGLAALTALATRLSSAAGGNKPFRIVVVDRTVVNAFAAPGEQIVIMRGLLDKAEGPDEIAGILAHEMGHGLELHPETGIVRAVGLTALTEFILGGSGGTIANIGLILAQLSYSRDAERQADGHALRILKNAGISTQGLSDFFKRVAKSEGSASKIGGAEVLLRTHPSPAERAQKIEQQPKYAATPALSSAEWAALKGICGAAPVKAPRPSAPLPDTTPQKTQPPAPPKAPPAAKPPAKPQWNPDVREL